MRVLVLGGGGREHALAWKLRQSPEVEAVLALPGNDGMAALATCIAGEASDAAAVTAAAAAHGADLVVVGPEAPLAAGVSDALRDCGHAVFGPSRAAAQLETSKIFAKDFMRRHRIPTADFAVAATPAEARRALARLGAAVAIKADGLAAGKGVVVTNGRGEAEAAAEAMLAGELAGEAGRRVVIEERLEGRELSLMAISDGARAQLLPPARDHKRLRDGDRGPNTGGMGAVSVDTFLPAALREQLLKTVVMPTLAGMAAAGTPFQGVLYCGLMLTPQGPRVLEFNARFGDPEAQAVLPRWGGDLGATLLAAAEGRLGEPEAAASGGFAAGACVVAAAAGYPGAYERGIPIRGLEAPPDDALVFHAGTRRRGEGWETAGGRVLGVAARAASQEAALARCYSALDKIHFRGMQLRRDIGKEEMQL